jgi:hypothetical protein
MNFKFIVLADRALYFFVQNDDTNFNTFLIEQFHDKFVLIFFNFLLSIDNQVRKSNGLTLIQFIFLIVGYLVL